MAGLTVEARSVNRLELAMVAVPDQGVDGRVGNLVVGTLRIRARLAAGVNALFAKRATRAFFARTARAPELVPDARLRLRLGNANSHEACAGEALVGHARKPLTTPDNHQRTTVRAVD